MPRNTSLTKEALEGFNAPKGTKCPYLFSSSNYYAWTIGQHFQVMGRPAPHNVSMSRGYKIHVSDMLFDMSKPTIERVK